MSMHYLSQPKRIALLLSVLVLTLSIQLNALNVWSDGSGGSETCLHFQFAQEQEASPLDIVLTVVDSSLQTEVCPEPVITVPAQICKNQVVTFVAPDLGFPCLTYAWFFGPNALPATATGKGPHLVIFNSAGTFNVSLTIDNGCDVNPAGGSNGSSGSNSAGTQTNSNGTTGSAGSTGSGGSAASGSVGSNGTGGVICPNAANGSNSGAGSSGSGSGSGSGSVGSGSNGSGSTNSGSGGSNSFGDADGQCIECRKTKTVSVTVADCPAQVCPTPVITPPAQVCKNQAATFVAPDLGFPCLTYAWSFGPNASPQTASGKGPHTVVYSNTGTFPVSLTIDNGCDVNPAGGSNGSSGSNSAGTQTNSNGTTGSAGSTGSGGSAASGSVGSNGTGGVICPNPANGSNSGAGSSGSGSGSGSGSVGSGSNGSGSNNSGSGGSNSNGDADGQCIECRKTTTINVVVIDCNAQNGSIGDFVWNDLNQNGVQDPGEAGVANVVVQLKNCSNTVLQTTTTNASGGYFFGNLVAACYRIGVSLPGGFQFSPQDAGGNDAADSDISPGNSMTADINLATGQNINTVDAGIFSSAPQGASIGDFVWNDLNGNGLQDPGEPGIPNSFVMLMTCGGAFVTSTNTNASGLYLFNNVAPGSYKVFFANPNGGTLQPTAANQGGDATDSDADNTGFTACFNLAAGEQNTTIDAGFKPIGGGCQVSPVVSNIQCNDNGTPNDPSDDTYTFVLRVTANGGSSGWNALINGVNVTGAYGASLTLGPYSISAGPLSFVVKDNANANCQASVTVAPPAPCSVPPAPGSIGDFVWNDLNQNGQQDFGEPGVANVTVRLFKCDNTFVAQTATNAQGFYSFNNLATNMQYFVEFSGLPAGFSFSPKDASADNIDSDANPANGRTDCTFLSPGENDNSIDAGAFSPAPQNGSIGDFVWNDLDQDGVQDPGEPGRANVTVRLKNCSNAVLQVTTTNANGAYSFSNLPAACYRIGVDLPAGLQFSPQDVGNDNTDSDINPGTAMTGDVNLAAGQNNTSVDAGIFQPSAQTASVGDFVWNDQNGNNVQDPGEPGVQGVTVKLFRCDNTFVGTFTTNANGGFLFTNLNAGSYFLEFSNLPAGFIFVNKNGGFDVTKDSDVNPGTGRTDCFNLAAGQTDLTRDAGIRQQGGGTGPGSVSDFVWFDTNGNGIQDPGEPGIPNVFVILETCTGAFVNFATTNAQGQYLISNVQPGQYRVKFASPGTFNGSPVQFTLQNAGNDDSKDSDADWLGFTGCFTVNPGQSNTTVDAGFSGEGPPPPVCTLNGSVSNVVCNNGQVTFTLMVSGTNTGAWGYDIPALNQFMLNYNQPYNFTIPGSANPTVLQLTDHDVAGCTTTVTITSPPPCNSGGGGGGSPCDGVSFSGSGGKITVSGLTSPIEIVKVFNSSWQTVFECSATCANPTVTGNLPAGSYFVKVQLFSATWQLICTKEGNVTVSAFTGGGSQLILPEGGNEVAPASQGEVRSPANSERNAAAADDFGFSVFPNPASGFVKLDIRGREGKTAVIQITDLTGREVKRLEISELDGSTQEMDLTGINNGLYFVRLLVDGEKPVVRQLMLSSY